MEYAILRNRPAKKESGMCLENIGSLESRGAKGEREGKRERC